MREEDKDLLEPDEEEEGTQYSFDDLADFVDLSDLGDLESADNMDVFGSLGDLTDLGDVPDLTARMDASDEMPDIANMDLTESMDDDIADITGLDLTESMDDDIPDMASFDISEDDLDIPDITSLDEDVDTVDLDSADMGDMTLTDTGLSDFGDSDAGFADMDLSDFADADTGIADMDLSDIGSEMSDMDLSNFGDSDMGTADMGLSDFSDMDLSAGEPEGTADMDLSDFSGADGLADADLGAFDFDTAEPEETTELLSDGSDGDLLGFDEFAADAGMDGMSGMGSFDDTSDMSQEFTMTEDGLLGDDLNIDFGDASSNTGDATVGMDLGIDTGSSSGGSGIDSMLDGLLDNLDMTGSLDDGGRNEMDDSFGMGGEDMYTDMDGTSDLDELNPSMIPPEQEEKKPGFFKKIFGNVVTDEIAEEERKAAEQEAEEAEKKAEDAQKAAEEKAALKEQKKAEKEAKAAEKKKEKEEKKAQKAAEKAEKKAREEEEAAQIEIVGKLNKVGVSIIAVCTLLFLVLEIAGTNLFSYRRAKKEATNYFEMGKYTEAYQAAIGTDMKDKDSEEYDKIKTVMRVQQAINAYQNYVRVSYYPEALDALLRGLKRYDANIEHGTALEVDQDMMACRKQILSILQTEFQMSETEAYSIISMDKPQYQDKVISLGIKKAKS